MKLTMKQHKTTFNSYMKKLYKHTYTTVVLSESPDSDTLHGIPYSVDEGPDCLSSFSLTNTQELTGEDAIDAIYSAGSEPSFFGFDEE